MPAPRTVESYILHFDREIYGESVKLSFVARLRDELNFASVASLIAQIHVDVADAEKILAGQGFASTTSGRREILIMGLARFTVDVATAGMRLDVFVASHYAAPAAAEAMSRAGVQKLIDAGHVTVNGARVKSSVRVKLADHIEIQIPAVREIGLIAEDLPLAILYEDQDIIVIHKAAGMVVHPAAGRTSGTLVNAILHHCPAIAGIGGERRPGIVHRLDKDTSGVMVVAKNDLAMRSLVDQFKGRTVRKEYVALVHGRMAGERGEIDRAIGRHRSDRKRMSSLRVLGKSRDATTRVDR